MKSVKTSSQAELIDRRRRQLHVHSIIYYFLNTSIVPDATFDKWAKELVQLHEDNPKLVTQGYMWQDFATWTGDTGMHLPVNPRIVSLAESLVQQALDKDLTIC